MLKLLFSLLFLIPSLSLGLTFKDGKQVEDVTEWVTWVEDAIVVEKETKGPDGKDILKDLEILIQ